MTNLGRVRTDSGLGSRWRAVSRGSRDRQRAFDNIFSVRQYTQVVFDQKPNQRKRRFLVRYQLMGSVRRRTIIVLKKGGDPTRLNW